MCVQLGISLNRQYRTLQRQSDVTVLLVLILALEELAIYQGSRQDLNIFVFNFKLKFLLRFGGESLSQTIPPNKTKPKQAVATCRGKDLVYIL